MGLFNRVRSFFFPSPAIPDDLAASVAGERSPIPRELSPGDFQVKREMYPLIPFSGWTGDAIQAAVDSIDSGNFGDGELLYHAMTKEPRIGAGLQQRSAAIRQFPWWLDVPADAPEELKILAEALQKDWQGVFSDEDRGEVIERVVMFGFCVCRVQWSFANGQQQPKIIPWSHSYIQWRPDWRAFQISTLDRNDPLSRIVNDGREWVVFSLGGERPWLKGAMRKLAFAYFNVLVSQDRWLHLNDAFGEPTKCLTVPRLMRESTEVAKMAKVVEALRAGDYLILPKDKDGYGYEYKLVQASAQSFETFRSVLLDLWYANIAIVLLGHNLSQFNKGASLAAQKSATNDTTRTLSESDAKILQDGFTNVGRVWVRANFGYNEIEDFPEIKGTLEKYTWKLLFDLKEPEDAHRNAQTANAYASGMAAYAKNVDVSAQPIDWAKSAERAGFVLLPLTERPEGGGPAPKPKDATSSEGEKQQPGASSQAGKPEKPESKPPEKPKQEELADRPRLMLLASGDEPSAAAGLLEGQAYIDKLADEKHDQPGLALMLAALAAAADWGDLRTRLVGALEEYDPRPRAEQLQELIAMADHAGRHSVDADLPEAARIEVAAAERRASTVERLDEQRAGLQRQRRAALVASAAAGLAMAALLWRRARSAEQQGADLMTSKPDLEHALREGWGDGGPLADTARFEPLQRAFAHARLRRLSDPAVAAVYPYWIYDAILDGRTTTLCRGLSGTVRPASDPWWQTHAPPLHWACRSHIRGLTRAQGEGRVSAPPAGSAETGFGQIDQEWMPDEAAQPAELWRVFRGMVG